MKKRDHSPVVAFYMETLLLIVVFVGILILLVQVFGLGKQRSAEARLLTTAVALAENTAEAAAARENGQDVLALLSENGNAMIEETASENGSYVIEAHYRADGTPDMNGILSVRLVCTRTPGEAGAWDEYAITVSESGRETPLYELASSAYRKGGK